MPKVPAAETKGWINSCTTSWSLRLKGDYDQFRLCWTAYSPPISSSRFCAAWDKAEHIVITQIAPAPGKAGKKVYVVTASVTLSPKHPGSEAEHRDVMLLVQWEDGHWVIAPAPRAKTNEQMDMQATATAAASEPMADSAP